MASVKAGSEDSQSALSAALDSAKRSTMLPIRAFDLHETATDDMDTMLNHIVLNYLIIEGHAHAIESFGQELGLELGSYMTTDLALDEDAQVEDEPQIAYKNVNLFEIAQANQQMAMQDEYMKGYEKFFSESATADCPVDETEEWVLKNPKLIYGLQTIHKRNLIKSSILEGQIPQAIGFLKRWFPQILDHGDYLVFQLLKLNVIEIIRSRQMPVDGPSDAEEQVFLNEILAYVKDNLLNRVKYNEDYFKELELTMALLCFNDLSPEAVSNPETSQLPAELVQLFDLRLRSTLATDINKAILSHSNTSIEDCDFSPASQLFTGMASSGTRGKPRQKGEPARPVSRVSDNESKLAKLLKLFEWTSNLMEQSKK